MEEKCFYIILLDFCMRWFWCHWKIINGSYPTDLGFRLLAGCKRHRCYSLSFSAADEKVKNGPELIRMARLWSIAAIVFRFCSIYTAAASKNCLRYLERMLRTLLVHFYSRHNSSFLCVLSLYLINDWITMIRLWDTVSTKKHPELSKKIVILHPFLPITATSPQRPLSSVLKVAVMARFDCKKKWETPNIKRWCTVARVTQGT